MRLKSLTLKGFKSFPDRTRLDFGPGVSVVVGPNGSGKSNVTDAVLWAMGEQSPLAVRGQSMQDVIFGGGRGVQARSAAEVEIVLDNSDGTVELPLSEISIVRYLDRSGEGGYRLNGARCRLTDVIELLSDTGLGKETHSVISQGRVEQIVSSKPRERRLLIEEAAGLGKHRKRRRRAQLKLERTQENLDRALDVEREARTRLRPLKRQAESAQLHERLLRQTLEARLELARGELRERALQLREAEVGAGEARAGRDQIEQELQAMIDRRGRAERALAERGERHDALTRHLYGAQAARERLALRAEQVQAGRAALASRLERVESELHRVAQPPAGEGDPAAAGADGAAREDRIGPLEAQLAEVVARHEREIEQELGGLQAQAEGQANELAERESELESARQERARAIELLQQARRGGAWSSGWNEVRRVIREGVERVLGQPDERTRAAAAEQVAAEAERVARGAVDVALKGVRAAEEAREQAEVALHEAERTCTEAGEQLRRTEWLIAQRRAALPQGALAVRRAELEGELAAERRQAERLERERSERALRAERLRELRAGDRALAPLAERLAGALERAAEGIGQSVAQLEAELAGDSAAGEQMAGELRACAGAEAQLQARLRSASEQVTSAEVAAQRVRDRTAEAEAELSDLGARLGLDAAALAGAGEEDQAQLSDEQRQALHARLERLERRREALGPVNPLAHDEYTEAVAHVEEMERRREDLETALRELRALIADTDRQIHRAFEETFAAAAENFAELVGEVFPGGSGRLRLVSEERPRSSVLGGQPLTGAAGENGAAAGEGAEEEEADEPAEREEEELLGVEIELTPAGKSTKRLSLLSGGEKSMTALAFLFAVFLARPCPFYILDEVEAALDDLNLDRFLALLRRYSERAQFIVITHQKRTMEAADWLYGVSMGGDGVSKVLSRRLPPGEPLAGEVAEVA